MTIYNEELTEGTVKTSYGIFKIDTDGSLICAYDVDEFYNDNWVQVDDLTDLDEDEYEELNTILSEEIGYELNGKFV